MVRLLLLLVLLAGCAPSRYVPGPPHPTWEELVKLGNEAIAKKQLTVKPVESKFEVKVYPAIILEGSATWVTCYVPPSYWAEENSKFRAIRLELSGAAFEAPLEKVEHKRFVERIPCGTWQAVCTIAGPMGAIERRTVNLTSKGECNSGEDR